MSTFKTVVLFSLLCLSAFVYSNQMEMKGLVILVQDGDTLTVLDGHQQLKIRLAEIDAPETDQPWGGISKNVLAKKVLGKHISLSYSSIDQYDRIIGRVYLRGRDINLEMIEEGHAWFYRKYGKDDTLEEAAKTAIQNQVGLWSLKNKIAPWDWRNKKREAADSLDKASIPPILPLNPMPGALSAK